VGVLDGPVRDGYGAILFPQAAVSAFDTVWHHPSPWLAPFVQQYWITTWDRRGMEAYVQRVLPSPSVHVTLKRGRSRVAGLSPRVFTEVLEDRHTVFGVRFRPGGFRPFLGRPVRDITGRFLPIGEVFGPGGTELEPAVLAVGSAEEMVALVEKFLSSVLPEPDPTVDFVARMVAEVANDAQLLRVDELARRFEMGIRRLQRIFAEYVGASPKWVIRRYRMQDAAAKAGAGKVAWARLAADLGYSDQAHFTRDFAANVGVAPSEYSRICAAGPSA
jgi:AraC-like DNA-binding protein